MRTIWMKYGTGSQKLSTSLVTRGGIDFKSSPTLASGDVKVSKDGGKLANITTLPTVTPSAGIRVEIAPSSTELECKELFIQFIDQTAPKEWEDEVLRVLTFGHASAYLVDDISAAKMDAATLDTALDAIQADTDNIQTRLPATLSAGLMQSIAVAVGTAALDANALAADAVAEIKAAMPDRTVLQETTIATLASQTSFTLTAGSADDAAYRGCTIVIEDASTATQKCVGVVDAYTGSTKTVTLLADPAVFTMAVGDKVYILAEKSLKPTNPADHHVDVDSNGAVEAQGGGGGGTDRWMLQETTIATLASQTSFTLTAGSADDAAYRGCTIVIEDASTATQKCVGIVDAYTGSTKTVTLLADPGVFTVAVGDKVYIFAEKALKPTNPADYHVDVDSGGAVESTGGGGGAAHPEVVLETTIATKTSDTQFTLTAGPTNNDALGKAKCIVVTAADSNVYMTFRVLQYLGASKTVYLEANTGLSLTVGDTVQFIADADIAVSTLAGSVWGAQRSSYNEAGSFGQTGNSLHGKLPSGNISDVTTAQVNAEVDAALDTAIPGSPTANSINERIKTLDDNYTTTRAAFLDKLNITGNVASSAEVTAIQNNTKAVITLPPTLERPDSGSTAFKCDIFLYDTTGNMEAPDSTPTLAAENESGTDRSGNLSAVSSVSTGHYTFTYTVASGHAIEQVRITVTVVEGGATRKYGRVAQVVDTTAVDFTGADRTKLDAIHAKLPSGTISDFTEATDRVKLDFTDTTPGSPTADTVGEALRKAHEGLPIAVPGASGGLPTVDASNRINGIQGTKNRLDNLNDISTAQVNAEVDTAIADARLDELLAADSDIDGAAPPAVGSVFHELMTKTAGSFTYDQTTDSLEAIRDRGDAAWGSAGSDTALLLDTTVASVESQTSLILTAGPTVDDALLNQTVVLYDASAGNAPCVRKITDYVQSAKRIILDSAAVFTVVAGDGVKVRVSPPSSSAPTAGEVAVAVWDEATASHSDAGTFGKRVFDIGEVTEDFDFSGNRVVATLSGEKVDLNFNQSGVVIGEVLTVGDTATALIAAALDLKLLQYRLNQIFTATAASPVANSWAALMTESDGASGRRFTAGALAKTPIGTVLHEGTAQSGGLGTIRLAGGASAQDDFYNKQLVHIHAGTGAGQARIVNDYTGSTRDAAVDNWVVVPDGTSQYRVYASSVGAGGGGATASEISDAVWDEARSGHVGAGTFGEAVRLLLAHVRNKVIVNKQTGETRVMDEAGTSELIARTVQPGATVQEVELAPS